MQNKAELNYKLKELYQQLKNGLNVFKKSDRWKEYLLFSTRFHHYSFSNTVLIWLRKPTATYVAGYRKWQELGRFVRPGEHGIPIFVPMMYKKKTNPAEDLNNEVKEEEILRGFRVGYVFDISQTDGKPVPDVVKVLSKTQKGTELYPRFKEISTVPIVEDTIQINGYFNTDKNYIVIRNDLPIDQKAKTLIHEIAHAILHTKQYESNQEMQELIAESVAFVVCAHFGIDSSEYSFGCVPRKLVNACG